MKLKGISKSFSVRGECINECSGKSLAAYANASANASRKFCCLNERALQSIKMAIAFQGLMTKGKEGVLAMLLRSCGCFIAWLMKGLEASRSCSNSFEINL